jgi:hypothetical protein
MQPRTQKEELPHCSQGHYITSPLPHPHDGQGQGPFKRKSGPVDRGGCVCLTSQKPPDSIPLQCCCPITQSALTCGLKIAGANLHAIYLRGKASGTLPLLL